MTVAVSGTAGCSRTATSEVPWITVVAGASGTGSGAVTFNVAANSGAARTGTLTIAGRAFTVTQAAAGPADQPAGSGPSCSYSIAPDNQSMGAAGGEGAAITISTSAGCAWTATSQASWITLDVAGERQRNRNRHVQRGGQQRRRAHRHLSIAGRAFTVSQQAAAARQAARSRLIPAIRRSAPTAGIASAVDVSTAAGCAWNATSNAGWITLVSGANGNGAGTVTFSVAANTGTARTGTLTIAGQTFTVNQASGCSRTRSIRRS